MKNKKKCRVRDCGKKTVARNLCWKHYMRFIKHGNTRTVLKRKTDKEYLKTSVYNRVKGGGE